MKKVLCLSFMLLAILFGGCENDFVPIELDKEIVYVPATGVNDKVSVTNFDAIDLSYALITTGDSIKQIRSVQDSDRSHDFIVEGQWFKLEVLKSEPNAIQVWVGDDQPVQDWNITVSIHLGDTFHSFYIKPQRNL